MKRIAIFAVLSAVFLSACGPGAEVAVEAEKWTALPKERIKLVADLRNEYQGTYASKYFWTIRNPVPDCGDLSCPTCSSTYWTAPADVSGERLCVVSAEVVLRDRAHPSYEESVTTIFEIKVIPLPVVNKAPVITQFVVPVQTVATNETISLYVEASDPEGGPIKDYVWSATCGKIVGDGTGVSWTAPSIVPFGGTCTVRVSVVDQENSATGVSAEFIIVV